MKVMQLVGKQKNGPMKPRIMAMAMPKLLKKYYAID